MALSPAMTVHDLLEAYPCLDAFLPAYHPVFVRLEEASQRDTWARMVTLAEASTVMNLPWRLFLRDLRDEVGRVTGVSPALASETLGVDEEDGKGDEVRSLVVELERGGSLADLARRMEAATSGLDDGQVADLARRHQRRGELAADEAVLGTPLSPPVAHGLGPGHPVAALRRECERLAQLGAHLEEAVDRLGERGSTGQRELLASLLALLDQLDGIGVQRERLARAWYPTLSSRGGRGPSALVDGQFEDVLRLAGRLRGALGRHDPGTVRETSRRYLATLRRTLASEEDLLVPLSLRVLDRDDWEALSEQERVIGWALQRD